MANIFGNGTFGGLLGTATTTGGQLLNQQYGHQYPWAMGQQQLLMLSHEEVAWLKKFINADPLVRNMMLVQEKEEVK